MTPSLIDLGVGAVVVISAFFAFARGIVREALAIVGWVGAVVATLQLFPYMQPFGRTHIRSSILADLATGTAIFVFTLVLFSLLSYAVTVRVRQSRVSALDRSLGFLFGIGRGAVVVCLAYLLLALVLPPNDQPLWLRQAKVTPLLEQGAVALLKVMPPETRPTGFRINERPAPVRPLQPPLAPAPAAEPAPPAAPSAPPAALPTAPSITLPLLAPAPAPAAPVSPGLAPLPAPAPAPAAPDSGGETGYKTDDRRALENLLRGQQQP